ncbi:CHASE3 domain-containing protein [Streptomyces sp. NPDC058255]|uniref:sensor histidine kinase n=1 Tax=Streptomyces sp. NPDC058255 TaxID=3346407 RepID=UPI0036E9FA74
MRRGLTVRMAVAGALLVVLVGTTFAFQLLAITQLRQSAQLSRQASDELIAADAMETVIVDLETGIRGYVITGEDRFLAPWDGARADFPAQARTLARLTATDGSPEGPRLVRSIVQGVSSYIRDYATPLLEAARRHDPSSHSVATTADGKQRVDALRAEVDRLRALEHARVTMRQERDDAAARRAIAGGVGGLAGAILLVLLFTGYLTRVIVLPVRRAAGMAGRLAGGELDTRLPETSAGEIGELEHAFNTMGGSLETSRDELTRLLGEQAALRRVATLVARGIDPGEIFSAVAEEICRLLDADHAGVARFDPGGTSAEVVGSVGDIGDIVGNSGTSGDDGAPIRSAVGTHVQLRDHLASAMVWRTGRAAQVNEDQWSGMSDPITDRLREVGIRSMVASPITIEGHLWGVVTVLTKRGPFPSGTADRMADFTELVATAVGNAESRAELAASRRRIVAAADETRRRIERDLHDGTQQRLVSLGLQLRLAQSLVPAGQSELETELGRVADELNAVVDDLREIARGIHPAILSEGGLGPALRTLARRAAIAVDLDVGTITRLPEPIEVVAYYVVSEALTNATRHARATVVRVAVEERDDHLHLSMRDDGVGGADPARGSGLIGLRDRAEALGGSIEVTSPPGEGTLILVRLPLRLH